MLCTTACFVTWALLLHMLYAVYYHILMLWALSLPCVVCCVLPLDCAMGILLLCPKDTAVLYVACHVLLHICAMGTAASYIVCCVLLYACAMGIATFMYCILCTITCFVLWVLLLVPRVLLFHIRDGPIPVLVSASLPIQVVIESIDISNLELQIPDYRLACY